ncbi:MAG TPA: DUF4145 domain-containing protein [Candidatus Baltobacteraceae bacterium]
MRLKRVTAANWLEADASGGAMVDGAGLIASVEGAVRFGRDVPPDVCRAFWSAAGAIGYAQFYAPVLTLASQQVLRVADFALEQFCIQKKSVVDREPFFARLKRLRTADLIGPQQYNRWDGLRSLRNAATHPRFVEQLSPAMALELITTVAAAINALPWTYRPSASNSGRIASP